MATITCSSGQIWISLRPNDSFLVRFEHIPDLFNLEPWVDHVNWYVSAHNLRKYVVEKKLPLEEVCLCMDKQLNYSMATEQAKAWSSLITAFEDKVNFLKTTR